VLPTSELLPVNQHQQVNASDSDIHVSGHTKLLGPVVTDRVQDSLVLVIIHLMAGNSGVDNGLGDRLTYHIISR
jgi:hypothetical protein